MFSKHLLVVLFGLAHFEVTSTNSVKKVVTVYRGNQDAVENQGCVPNFCDSALGLSCHSDGNCCRCQCLQDRPNYIVSKGSCLSNADLETNASCQYRLKAPQTPIASLDLANQFNGSHEIDGDSSSPPSNLVTCDHTLKINHWDYLDAHGKWIRGYPNVFSVKHKLNTVGQEKNRYLLEELQWNEQLDGKYAGVIIKVSLACGSNVIGCLLVKSEGKKAYNTRSVTPTTTPTTTPPPPPTTTDELNPTTPGQNNSDRSSDKQKQGDGNKRKTTGNSSNAALAPALGAVFGLLFVIALASVAVMLYRRRQKRNNEKPWRNPETDSVANLDDYAEPIYAEVNKGDFDNPVYSDPALDESNRRTAQLGPLPAVPGSETAYQPLNNLTRNYQDSDAKDYDNPIDGMRPSEDYDNPPVASPGSANEPSDYDNPPAQGTLENTSDYDNPPSVGGGSSEKTDYDVPRRQTADHIDDQESVDTQF